MNHFLQCNAFSRFTWFADVYVKPWCRIGPYIVGIMVGYLLHITDKQKPKIHKVFEMYLILAVAYPGFIS